MRDKGTVTFIRHNNTEKRDKDQAARTTSQAASSAPAHPAFSPSTYFIAQVGVSQVLLFKLLLSHSLFLGPELLWGPLGFGGTCPPPLSRRMQALSPCLTQTPIPSPGKSPGQALGAGKVPSTFHIFRSRVEVSSAIQSPDPRASNKAAPRDLPCSPHGDSGRGPGWKPQRARAGGPGKKAGRPRASTGLLEQARQQAATEPKRAASPGGRVSRALTAHLATVLLWGAGPVSHAGQPWEGQWQVGSPRDGRDTEGSGCDPHLSSCRFIVPIHLPMGGRNTTGAARQAQGDMVKSTTLWAPSCMLPLSPAHPGWSELAVLPHLLGQLLPDGQQGAGSVGRAGQQLLKAGPFFLAERVQVRAGQQAPRPLREARVSISNPGPASAQPAHTQALSTGQGLPRDQVGGPEGSLWGRGRWNRDGAERGRGSVKFCPDLLHQGQGAALLGQAEGRQGGSEG